MKYLHLIFGNLRRRWIRTFLTIGTVVIAFFLFGALAAVNMGFQAGVELAGQDRLVMRHKVSLIQPLPESYLPRIEGVEGVENAAYASWFGGSYQDSKLFFGKIAVDPADYFAIYPEVLIPEDQMQAWLADRVGAVVGKDLAQRFDWKVGDRIPIIGDIWRNEGDRPWEFNIVGIYDTAEGSSADKMTMFFRQDYLEEARIEGKGLVGWYVIQVNDPARADQIALNLDQMFANSSYETNTSTELAFVQGFAQQIGNTTAIIRAVLVVVFFTMLLVAGNTMAQAVRERTKELAVLKAMGFTDGKVVFLVLAEACLLAVLGGTVGLGAAALAVDSVAETVSAVFPVFYLPGRDVALGLAYILLLGLLTGALPAWQAVRLKVADALRRA